MRHWIRRRRGWVVRSPRRWSPSPSGDEHVDDDPERALRYASDLDPLKPRAECMVVGAYRPAPGRSPETEPAKNLALSFDELSNDCLKATKAALQNRLERSFLEQLMAEHGGNVSGAARAAGFHRTFLQKMLARHDLLGSTG